ncbi:hypothetical protein ACS0TY_004005 [Phlomoides rotata]
MQRIDAQLAQSQQVVAKYSALGHGNIGNDRELEQFMVIHDRFGIVEGLMSTVQCPLYHRLDLFNTYTIKREERRAGKGDYYPTSAVGKVLLALNGKLTGLSFRVPIVDVSVVNLTVRLEKEATYEDIKAAIKEESKNKLKGILGLVALGP